MEEIWQDFVNKLTLTLVFSYEYMKTIGKFITLMERLEIRRFRFDLSICCVAIIIFLCILRFAGVS